MEINQSRAEPKLNEIVEKIVFTFSLSGVEGWFLLLNVASTTLGMKVNFVRFFKLERALGNSFHIFEGMDGRG